MTLSADLSGTLPWLLEADPSVEQKARLLILDTVGCMIAGLARPELRKLVRHFAAQAQGTVSLPGAAAPLTLPYAAYLAGMAAGWD